ncbi:MAG: guanylate kinase [Candidatus Nanopelagicales bacterium]|jgi:guanylate kinase|nr:guanylate kinase [Candidatus Nanopelagicales bacterium]
MSRLYVVSGPSGVGKSTVVARLLADRPDIWLSVSATTREPRPGEQDGREYFFVSRPDFARLADEGQLLEWASFAGNSYGTPRGPVEQHLQEGPVLLEIELQGARQVRAAMPECVLVFLLPPSPEELKRRLVDRGTEDDAAVKARLARADEELAAQSEFDHVIRNVEVATAAAELSALIE